MSTRALTYVEHKSERIIDLLGRLESGAVLSTVEIAEMYGISQRTAQRLIASAEKFIPLDYPECTAGRRYRKWSTSHD
jgi:predicted DNA-binding transcriptional regulator YafY